jgi:hypothetical protein
VRVWRWEMRRSESKRKSRSKRKRRSKNRRKRRSRKKSRRLLECATRTGRQTFTVPVSGLSLTSLRMASV